MPISPTIPKSYDIITMRTNHSPMDVAEAIRNDIIKVRRISLSSAARSIGKSPNNLYNIISGKTRLSRATANLFHQTFGYSIDYMTMGKGELYSFEKAPKDVPERPAQMTERQILETLTASWETDSRHD